MSTTSIEAPRRAAAVLSLVCVAAMVVLLVAVSWRHLDWLLLGLGGLVLVALGGWWTVARQLPQRALAVGLALAGLVVVAVAMLGALTEADQAVLGIAAMVALTASAAALARRALRRPASPHPVHLRDRRVPRHAVLLCNPWSGGGKVERFGLAQLAGELGVEVVMLEHGLDLEVLARDAVARGADCLGMAGGDGSQALVASIAIEHDLPFVCVSAGTRNHFALDLGLDREDPRASMTAFVDAVERRVDVATVNDRVFVNNVSLGIYATVVQREEYRNAKAATFASLLPQLLGPDTEPFDLQFDEPGGRTVDGAYLILVSNNPYVIGASLDNFQRRALDTGVLGVIAVDAPGATEAARLVTASAAGLRRRSRYWHEFTCREITIGSRSGHAFVGVDGEALELPTPLRMVSHPLGLRLLVPDGNPEVAEERRARGVRLGDLVQLALGRPEAPQSVDRAVGPVD